MSVNSIRLSELTPDVLHKDWLWQFTPSKDGELWIKPTRLKTSKKFESRLVGCAVTMADGTKADALLEGIDLEVPNFSKHNRALIIWIDGYGWFSLCHYYSSDALQNECGPNVLCQLLGKAISDVYPIQFDIRSRSPVESPALSGAFEISPSWGLALPEVMEILVKESGSGKQKLIVPIKTIKN